jgi:hypothetical protein
MQRTGAQVSTAARAGSRRTHRHHPQFVRTSLTGATGLVARVRHMCPRVTATGAQLSRGMSGRMRRTLACRHKAAARAVGVPPRHLRRLRRHHHHRLHLRQRHRLHRRRRHRHRRSAKTCALSSTTVSAKTVGLVRWAPRASMARTAATAAHATCRRRRRRVRRRRRPLRHPHHRYGA